jgi:hypothetical protein
MFWFLVGRTMEEIDEPRRHNDTVIHGISLCFSVPPCLRGLKTNKTCLGFIAKDYKRKIP